MEERKLIRLGNSSFAIALPKDWIDKAGLKKGDKVFILPNSNGELIVSPEFKKGNAKEIDIHLGQKDDSEIARDIISAYISGNKTLNFFGDKDKIQIAKTKVKNFLNLELIEENDKKVVFRDLLDIEEAGLEKFIKRMDTNIKEMFRIISNIDSKSKLKSIVKELEEIDRDVTKFYFLVWRIMNLGVDNPGMQVNLKTDSKSFIRFFWISYNIEQIGDDLKRIARKLEDVSNFDKFKQLLKSISENYECMIKSFFENDKENSKKVILKKDVMMDSCNELSKIKGFEAIAEKLNQINSNIHSNSKMIFYGV